MTDVNEENQESANPIDWGGGSGGTATADNLFTFNPKRLQIRATKDHAPEAMVVYLAGQNGASDTLMRFAGIDASGNLFTVIRQGTLTAVVKTVADNTDTQSNFGSNNGLIVGAVSHENVFDGTQWQRLSMPTLINNATATGAASTQLVAAVAAKKYRIWGIAISAVATAAATDGVVTVNEVTSGAVLLSLRVSATSAAVETTSLQYQGAPQPNANNAIQVTSIANVTTDATLVCSAAY